jgi:uncharacterized phage-associated protein
MAVTVMDTAQSVIDRLGPEKLTTIKLQKLVYYCQAWSLVWDDAPLFPEKIEAWANGPVVPELFRRFKGEYYVPAEARIGNAEALSPPQKETVEAVCAHYGDKTTAWLVELTHLEAPWKNARERARAQAGELCTEIITISEMAEYYSSLIR